MTSLALIVPCLLILLLGWLFYRGATLWLNMLSSLWGSQTPFLTRATGWSVFAVLSAALIIIPPLVVGLIQAVTNTLSFP
jgi:hypothetical protein